MTEEMGQDEFFVAVDDEHIQHEKAKARELRRSQWWKNQKGKGTCYYCQADVHPKELTMDHIVPLARGGVTRKSNVVPCCQTCNEKKKYLLPIEWQEYLDALKKKR